MTALAVGVWISPCARAGEPCVRIEPGGPGDCDANGFLDDCDFGPHALGYAVRELHNPPASYSVAVLSSLDFEPDGDTDILFFGESEALSFTNRGGGRFDAPLSLPIRSGLTSTVAADIDGDGIPDIVTTDRIRTGVVLVFRGDGAGRFQPFREFLLPDAYYVAAGDLDGDGRPEILVADDRDIHIGIYSLDQALQPVLRQVIAPPRYTVEARLADFDRDGDLDIFLRNPFVYSGGQVNGVVFIWRNEGSLEFTEEPVVERPDLIDLGGFALLDLDGDGWLDVVFSGSGSGSGDILVAARNDRRAGFLSPVEIARTPVRITSITGADFDGDGDTDLLLSLADAIYPTGGGEALLFENLTRRVEAAPFDFVREGFSRDKISALRSAVAADVDGKGSAEFVVYAREEGCGAADALLILSPLREPRSADCDGNGIPDPCDIESGGASDRDRDGIPDRCEPKPPIERCSASRGASVDCNANGIDDACDVRDPTVDADGDGVPDLCQTAGLAFGITGPGLLRAPPGEEAFAEYASRFYPGELLGTEPGIQGWAVGIRAYGCEVVWASTAETDGGEFCEGGPRRHGIGQTEIVRREGVSGVVSAIILSMIEPVTIPLDRPGLMLRIGVRAIGPEEGETVTARLVHEDGLRGQGTPVHNASTRRGETVYPELFGRAIAITSVPATFRRADANTDGVVDISDAIHTLSNLFIGGPRSACRDAADFDDSGSVDISDIIATLQMLFLGGPRPPSPGKFECGVDPTPDSISCVEYGACG